MMENMGWQGKGLGKQEQGMLNPLITKKAAGSSTTGVIVESTIAHPELMAKAAPKVAIKVKESNILVLQYSPGLGQTADFLRGLCEQYGEIGDAFERENGDKCKFYVQYLSKEDSIKAYTELS